MSLASHHPAIVEFEHAFRVALHEVCDDPVRSRPIHNVRLDVLGVLPVEPPASVQANALLAEAARYIQLLSRAAGCGVSSVLKTDQCGMKRIEV
jgi:hypothetical protein